MKHKYKKNQWGLVIAFIVIIAGLPISDAMRDYWNGKPIQSVAIFRDTFLTPLAQKQKSDSLFAKLDSQIQMIPLIEEKYGLDSAMLYSEASFFLLNDFMLLQQSPNEYVSLDSSAELIGKCLSLQKQWKKSLDNWESAWDIKLGKNWEKIKKQWKDTPESNISIWATAFFNHTVFNPQYLRAFETKMEDQNIVAQSSIPWMQNFYANIFKEYGIKAIKGKGDWLFYRPGVQYLTRPHVLDPRNQTVDANDTPLTENPIQVIKEFRDQLALKNIELLVVIVPAKGNVYPEFLNPSIDKQTKVGSMGYSIALIDSLNKIGIHTVDLFSTFENAKHKDTEGDYLYLKQDTHWKNRGLKIAAQKVAQKIRTMAWYQDSQHPTEYISQNVKLSRMGDIAEMTELENIFAPESIQAERVFAVQKDSNGQIISRTPYRDDLRKSRILVLGDSFSRIYQTDAPRNAGFISHLAKELQEPLASIVSDGGASTLVRQKLARKPKVLRKKKLVVWEFVERDFRFGAEGWKKVDL